MQMRTIIMRDILISSAVFVLLIVSALSPSCIPKALASDSYRLYVHNRDRNNYYKVRITNEDSRRQDSLTVNPASCDVFPPTDEGEYSVRVYRGGTMLADYATIDIGDTSCIEINSVTGKVSLCDRYWCLD